jgi:hypothetical protein
MEPTTHRKKNHFVMKCHRGPRTWKDSLDTLLKLRKMNMGFGTWNIRSLYRVGSLLTVAKEIAKYKLDLAGVQEVRWDRGGMGPADKYIYSSIVYSGHQHKNENKPIELFRLVLFNNCCIFYERTENLINVIFMEAETKRLNEGFRYNLHYKKEDWIKTLAIEVDPVISKIHERNQKYIRQNSSKQHPKTHKQTKDTKRKTTNNPIKIRITRMPPYKQYKEENKPKPVNHNQSQ